MKRVVLILVAILTASSLLLAQAEKIDFAAIGRIKEIGLARSQTRFHDEATMNGFNTVADLPGSDLASEVVLLGAHLDSHPYATGATDTPRAARR